VHSVEFQGVSKSYPIYASPGDRLKELLTLNRRSWHRDFWALGDVSFSIRPGETFCVIGENGAGKSTLLQLVAGILQPTTGSVAVNGRVSALLELGSGFNPDFTGRDNVYLNAAILGFSKAEIDRRYKQIEEFAEIGDFIDQPVKTYSSGMAVRLAFAVAIHVDPEILLVDEALAVGDIYFRQRCLRKVHELRARGITILFVSHAISDVKAIGDRTLWLEQGRMQALGETDTVVSKYMAAMSAKDSAYVTQRKAPVAARPAVGVRAPEIVDRIPNVDHRHGDERAAVLGIAVVDSQGRPLPMLEPLSTIVVRISVLVKEDVSSPIVGFMLRNHLGIDFSGTNTARLGTQLPPMMPGDIYTVDFHVQLPELYPGSFSFSPAIADGTLDSYHMCDWIDNALALPMGHSQESVYGFLHLPSWVEVNGRLTGQDPIAEKSVD
jgi:ABC-type polysaccharide/polyol phosphate transport system ATPase subunit